MARAHRCQRLIFILVLNLIHLLLKLLGATLGVLFGLFRGVLGARITLLLAFRWYCHGLVDDIEPLFWSLFLLPSVKQFQN